MRCGDLARDRLELAAYLGHEAARSATPVAVGLDSNGFYARIEALTHGEQVRVVAAALELGLATVPLAPEVRSTLVECARHVGEWLARPTPELSPAARRAASASRALENRLFTPGKSTPQEVLATAATEAVMATVQPRRALRALGALEYALDRASDEEWGLTALARLVALVLLHGAPASSRTRVRDEPPRP